MTRNNLLCNHCIFKNKFWKVTFFIFLKGCEADRLTKCQPTPSQPSPIPLPKTTVTELHTIQGIQTSITIFIRPHQSAAELIESTVLCHTALGSIIFPSHLLAQVVTSLCVLRPKLCMHCTSHQKCATCSAYLTRLDLMTPMKSCNEFKLSYTLDLLICKTTLHIRQPASQSSVFMTRDKS